MIFLLPVAVTYTLASFTASSIVVTSYPVVIQYVYNVYYILYTIHYIESSPDLNKDHPRY